MKVAKSKSSAAPLSSPAIKAARNAARRVITVAILGVLRSAVVQVGARLMDAVDPGLVAKAREAVASVDGITSVRTLRLRWIGHTLHAEGDVTTTLTDLAAAHEVAHHAEEHLLEALPRLAGATVHVSPAGAHD